MTRETPDYEVNVDGDRWYSISPHSDYDAIHCVAGAILAGADEITIEKVEGGRGGGGDLPRDQDGWPLCPECNSRLDFNGRCHGCDWRARQ